MPIFQIKALDFTNQDYSQEIAKENITHDLITARVLRELLNWKYFSDGRMFHQIESEELLPDAEVTGYRYGRKYVVALEVEAYPKITVTSQRKVSSIFKI